MKKNMNHNPRLGLFLYCLAMAALVGPALSAAPSLLYGFMPSIGEPRMLAILVQAVDRPAHLSEREIKTRLFSREDDGFVSMAEYYESVSYGKLRIRGEVTPWLTLPRPMSKYGTGKWHEFRSWPHSLGGMADDAVTAAVGAGFNLADYDNDGDGHVDGLMIIHSGPGGLMSADPADIHSRLSYISFFGHDPLQVGGVVVDRFAICPEYFSKRSPQDVRVYAHETGHLLGLPDLVDHDGSSMGVGAFSLMAYPVPRTPGRPLLPPEAYCKILLGWVSPVEVKGPYQAVLRPEAQQPDVVKIGTGVVGEYFLMSYRAPVGADADLFGKGILVWHVNDRAVYRNRNECSGRCESGPLLSLVQADGKNDLEMKRNKGDSGDFFPPPYRELVEVGADTGSSVDPFLGANTLTYGGEPTGIRIRDISIDGPTARAEIVTDDHSGYCGTGLCLQVAGYKWEELRGNGNGFPEDGEKVRLVLEVINQGTDARGIKLKAEGQGVRWNRSRDRVPRIEAGQRAEASFTLTVGAGFLASAFTDQLGSVKGAAGQGAAGQEPELPEKLQHSAWVWSPTINAKVKKPAARIEMKTQVLVGVPPLLVVNDAPHNLIPLALEATQKLNVPCATHDVLTDGLPPAAMVSAPKAVVWMAGVNPLSEGRYPDPERLRLFRAVLDSGHDLIFSVSLMESPIPADALDLLNLSAVTPLAAIRLARDPAPQPGARPFNSPMLGPYSPNLTPHLELQPGPRAKALLEDERGRTVAITGPGEGRGTVTVIGFPLEALYAGEMARLLTMILSEQMGPGPV